MLKKLLLSATFLCAASFANAAIVTQSANIASQPTNFEETISFTKFDDMGGTRTLTSVSFTIDGTVEGSASAESRDAQAATLVTTLEAELSLTDINGNELVVTIPSISNTFMASAFDGSIDFDGTSGIEYPNLSVTKSETASYSTGLLGYVGTGMLAFDFNAMATSSVTGAGNIVSQLSSNALGTITVVYTYEDNAVPVSAPGHIALMGFGLLAFAGFRNARK